MGKLVIQQVQTEVRFWSLVLCNGNVGNEPYSVACQGSLPFLCMAKLMVVTSTAQINMSVVAWHSTVCAWKHWWDFLEEQNWVNQCDVVHIILRSQQNSMNTWPPFCMVIITRILMHFIVCRPFLWTFFLLRLAALQTYQGRLCNEMYHSRGHFHQRFEKVKQSVISNWWLIFFQEASLPLFANGCVAQNTTKCSTTTW